MGQILTAVKSYITQPRTTRLITEMGLRASDYGSRLEHVDLHFHSHHSDGSFSPQQLALLAKFLGLKATALADHDTDAGVQEMQKACSKLGITNIPAIELSTTLDNGKMHLLGYHMTFTYPGLLEKIEEIQEIKKQNDERDINNRKIGEFLGYSLSGGARLTTEKDTQTIMNAFPQAKQSEIWYAKYFNHIGEMPDLISAYLFIKQKLSEIQDPLDLPYPSLREGIGLIHADGGIPIWAHPWRTHEFFRGNSTEDIFNMLVTNNLWGPKGLMGLECPLKLISELEYHSLTKIIDALTDKGIDPILTWGSDFHGGRFDTFGGDYPSKRKAQIILDQLDAAKKDKSSILTN